MTESAGALITLYIYLQIYKSKRLSLYIWKGCYYAPLVRKCRNNVGVKSEAQLCKVEIGTRVGKDKIYTQVHIIN